jgi:serine/threonine-protein kinase
VDVYGLGAILYALLAGRAPFQSADAAETLLAVREKEPANPRALNPKVPVELSAICLKCLEKDPARRYDSPRTLAEDLGNWLEGRPVQARPLGRVVRAWRCCRRNAALTIFIGMAAVLTFVAGGAFILRAAQKVGRHDEILDENLHLARNVANIVLNRFQKWGADVERAASSRELVSHLEAWNQALPPLPEGTRQLPAELLESPESRWLQNFSEELHRQKDPAIVNWHVLDARGFMVSRTPDSPVRGGNFQQRDYFKRTLDHAGMAGRIHVSSVYRSIADNHYKFDVCVPVCGEKGVVGVIAASVTTDPTWGLPDIHDARRKAVLVAPWDPDRASNDPVREGPVPEYLILLHPAYVPGQSAVSFDKKLLPVPYERRCDQDLAMPSTQGPGARKRGYADPFGNVDPKYLGRWLAGFAPVGNTGFVLIIQRHED